MERVVKSGPGWRMGWNPQAEVYKALLGGEDWAMELTEAEFEDFCRLVGQLTASMSQMASELMDEEKIACEAECDRLWMEVEGYPQSYSLRFILSSGRRCEGYWPPVVVPELLPSLNLIKMF